MKISHLFIILFICSATIIYAQQSNLEWQLNGSTSTTTVFGEKEYSNPVVNNYPLININWRDDDENIPEVLNLYNYRILNDGVLKLKFSSDGTSYSDILNLSSAGVFSEKHFIAQSQATFNDISYFNDNILVLNSSFSIGDNIADITINPHKFQVEGSSNMKGGLDVSGITTLDNDLIIKNEHYLEFGNGEEKDVDAGRIHYNTEENRLDIYGGRDGSGDYKIRLHDQVLIGANSFTATEHTEWALAVKGKIISESVVCRTSTWGDYVFDDSYELMPLNDVEKFISENGHLPNIPSEKEVIDQGIDLAEMNRMLMVKIEELTLHMIELEKQLNELR